MPWGIDIGGLNLDEPFTLEPKEWSEFARVHGGPLGFPEGMPTLRMWSEYRPDLVKIHRMNMRHDGPHVPGKAALPFITADLHTYLLFQWQYGVQYELVIGQNLGVSREEILDAIAVASLDTISRGLDSACTDTVRAMLRDWPDVNPSNSGCFPAHWPTDRSVLTSGIDLGEPGLTGAEKSRLEEWYLKATGEVPPWFGYMTAIAPGMVKTHRIRFERALRVSPPAALPFYRLHYAIQLRNEDAIRENFLLGRAFGMTDEDLRGTILHGLLISGGPTNGAYVQRALGGLFD
jgi:hypothetical protein